MVGKLVIISGRSGAGKSTVLKRLLEKCALPLVLSVSATTRPAREGEQNGVDYHFLSPEEFANRRDAGDFLEFKEVFGRGDWYGTLVSEVHAGLNAGKWVVLEIDVEGTLAVVEQIPDAITLFLYPGSLDELEHRLRTRGTETENAIQRRLEVARRELESKDRYRHEVMTETVEQAVDEICHILIASREMNECWKN